MPAFVRLRRMNPASFFKSRKHSGPTSGNDRQTIGTEFAMNEARAHLLIEGMVQGVFYRAFTRDIAHTLGLKGWVRNLYDGRVEAVFEGKKQIIEQAIQECFSGPPGARVTNVEVKWEEFQGDLKGFTVRY